MAVIIMKITEFLNGLQDNAEDYINLAEELLVKYKNSAKRLKKFEDLFVTSATVLNIVFTIIFIAFFVQNFFHFNLFLNPNIRIEYLFLVLLPQAFIMIIFDKKHKKLNNYLKNAKYYNNLAGKIIKVVFNAMQKYQGDEEITTSQMQEILGEI